MPKVYSTTVVRGYDIEINEEETNGMLKRIKFQREIENISEDLQKFIPKDKTKEFIIVSIKMTLVDSENLETVIKKEINSKEIQLEGLVRYIESKTKKAWIDIEFEILNQNDEDELPKLN